MSPCFHPETDEPTQSLFYKETILPILPICHKHIDIDSIMSQQRNAPSETFKFRSKPKIKIHT
jgi:hypothetical protein